MVINAAKKFREEEEHGDGRHCDDDAPSEAPSTPRTFDVVTVA